MAAVAHVWLPVASPAVGRRPAWVRAGAVLAPPARVASPSAVYRRRRAVALLAVVTVVSALVLALSALIASFGGASVDIAERPAPAPAEATGAVYVVQPGDTFWDIARRLQPGGDPRPLVTRMVAAHGSASLVAGERLVLPAG